jgi:hypothetical protein
MSRPRFADEDVRGSIIRAARRLVPTIEIATIVEQGWSSARDEEVLDLAWEHSWLVVSHDVNTMKAVAEYHVRNNHGLHGLLLVPRRRSVTTIAECLALISEASTFEEWRDRIVYLPF